MVNIWPKWKMCWPFTTGLLIQNAPDSAASAVRFDERPCQLLEDVVVGLRVKPGKAAKEDNEYIRQGTGVVLLAYDYERGIRYTQTRKRRTKADYAEFMQQIVSTYYADIEHIDLVQDKGTGPPAKHAQVWFILRAFTLG